MLVVLLVPMLLVVLIYDEHIMLNGRPHDI